MNAKKHKKLKKYLYLDNSVKKVKKVSIFR